MDPNPQAELAPTLQAIGQQAQIAMNGAGGVGSQATAAGAFGALLTWYYQPFLSDNQFLGLPKTTPFAPGILHRQL